jgi:hypothetical protein
MFINGKDVRILKGMLVAYFNLLYRSSGETEKNRDKLQGWSIGVQFPAGAVMGLFSLRHRVQTGSGEHPPSYLTGIGGPFAEVKMAVA